MPNYTEQIELPIKLGQEVWFMIGMEVYVGTLVGFDYVVGHQPLLHATTLPDGENYNITPDNAFPTKEALKNRLLELLLHELD